MLRPRIFSPTEGSIQQLVEVNPVAEDDVATHVEQKALRGDVSAGEAGGLVGLRGRR